MSAEGFHKISSGINSLVIAGGIIVAGVWSWYIFNAELHIENAKARLEKTNRDLRREPRLEVDLEMKQLATDLHNKRILLGTLTLRNPGTGPLLLHLAKQDEPPIRVYEVSYGHTHEVWKNMVSFFLPGDKDLTLGELVIRPGSISKSEFSVTVPRSGLYVTVFRVPVSSEDKVLAKSLGSVLPIYWRASTYIWVK